MKDYTDKLIVYAQVAWQKNGIDLSLGFRQQQTGHFYVAQPLVFQKSEDNEVPRPLMTLTNTDAQVLMDQLWNCGVRPTEGAGSAGSMAAQAKHLADMRAIAFGMLSPRVEKP